MTAQTPADERGHESDQLPEEAPPEQIVEDVPGGARKGVEELAEGEHPGMAASVRSAG